MNETAAIWGHLPPSLVIFDLDGTLVDSLEDLAASIDFMRGRFGLASVTVEHVRNSIGKGARNLVTRCMPDNDCRIDEALALFLEHNGANLAVRTRLYPGACELLATLNTSGIPLALVSNKNTEHCNKLLSQLGIGGFFHAVLGGDATVSCKPSPEPLLEAIVRADARTETTVMVGDSSNDFLAANRAGVRSVGCTFGYGGPWEQKLADVRIASLDNLLPLPW
jgi:phosphoglycolate phosphatase